MSDFTGLKLLNSQTITTQIVVDHFVSRETVAVLPAVVSRGHMSDMLSVDLTRPRLETKIEALTHTHTHTLTTVTLTHSFAVTHNDTNTSQ